MALAQTSEKQTSPLQLYQEGEQLFRQEAYAAALKPLRDYVRQETDNEAHPERTARLLEAGYMLVCSEYELGTEGRITLLQTFLEEHPDTPHANRLHALVASAHFFEGRYEEALQAFARCRMEQLGGEERDDMTYRLAVSYLQTGRVKEAAVWFDTLRSVSSKYAADCTYYLAYIHYTRGRHDEALQGFLSLQTDSKYRSLVPYYIAEIYLLKQENSRAASVARDYLAAHPDGGYAGEMQRVLGTACYRDGQYLEAMKAFGVYREEPLDSLPRRDALYMEGISCYQCGVYTQVPLLLGEVTRTDGDALAQNAYLHMGLAYLQLDDKNKARLAFEQAAASDADLKVSEQAAYNHALCIHETSYSAFGESVTVFEKFLNRFPASTYADEVGSYLVEVYMNTRSYEAALSSIERIKQPGNAILEAKQKILFQLGTQSFANTRFDQAADYFERSIALGRYNAQTKAEAVYWLGEAHYRLGHMDEAQENFVRYLHLIPQRNTPTAALAYYNLGYIAFNRKDYDKALDRFETFLQVQRQDNRTILADAYNRMADCYMHDRQFEEAKTLYTKAGNLATSAGDYSNYQLALVAGLQKDYAGKVQLLDRLTEKYPQSPYVINALYEKGRSYVQAGESRQAIASFRELLDKYPESPVSRKAATEIALLYYQNEDYNRAIEAYKHVIVQYPGSEEARLAMRDLKTIYVEANRVDEFAALASEMPGEIRFEANEQDSLTYVAAEKVYMRGDHAGSKESFGRYLKSFPDGAYRLNCHYYLSLIGREEGNDDAVLEHTGKLLTYPDTPYSEEALLMHSEILYNRGDYATALPDYRKLQARAATPERRIVGTTGILRCAARLNEDAEAIQAATALLSEDKLSHELQNEALYLRAKAYLNQQAKESAMNDLRRLAKDTRTSYGAEAKYLVGQLLYDAGDYATAEREILEFIDQSTPHAYWLARGFILLSDVYVAMDKQIDARQYLLSLQQNYPGEDDILPMIEERLEKLK